MEIYQLQASYQAQQDRIQLRLSTQSNEEFRLWLTRRMVKSFFPHLVQISAQQASNPAQLISHDSSDHTALATFKKQESLAKADFQTPYSAEMLSLPIGSEPLLATKMHVTQLEKQQLRLGFEEESLGDNKPRAFEVTVGPSVLHSLLHLLEVVLKSADWGFVATQAPPPPETGLLDDFAAAVPPVYLN
jgi:hypothetical protein